MNIMIEEETKVDFSFDYKELIHKVIMAAMDYENCPYESEISVTMTDDQGIQEINKEFREIDKPTDVLSFPMVEYEQPGTFDFLEESQEAFHPESGELLLGDIVLNINRIRSQAEEYGHSEIRELAFLVAHSMLHLFGYDHMEDEERIEMERRQEEILHTLGIDRFGGEHE